MCEKCSPTPSRPAPRPKVVDFPITEGGAYEATRERLLEADRINTLLGKIALGLAQRFDAAVDSGSGFAALAKQLRPPLRSTAPRRRRRRLTHGRTAGSPSRQTWLASPPSLPPGHRRWTTTKPADPRSARSPNRRLRSRPRQQQLVLDQLFAFDRHGDSVAFETGVVAPRQNLKTAVCRWPRSAGCSSPSSASSSGPAHEFHYRAKAFRDMTELINPPRPRPRSQTIYRGNGDEPSSSCAADGSSSKPEPKAADADSPATKSSSTRPFALRAVHMGSLPSHTGCTT